jgi:N-formylglutamate deformylase
MPHCSAEAPAEIMEQMLRSGEPEASVRRRLLIGGDPLTDQIFHVPECTMLKADYSRFVVDLNRCAKDGPCNENGVIKLKDFHLQSFYPSSFTLSQAERDRRIELYYKPFHAQMLANLQSGRYTFFIDGHSMDAFGPPLSCDHRQPRPAICIGNNAGIDSHVSCPFELMEAIRTTLLEFAPFAALLQETGYASNSVTFNQPFTGGYITHAYAALNIQGVLIEVNRALYFDEELAQEIPGRVALLNATIRHLVLQLPSLQDRLASPVQPRQG